MMVVKCAWCGKIIDDSNSCKDDFISHGICSDCLVQMSTKNPSTLQDFLNSLNVPVIVVNEDGILQILNKAARLELGKTSSEAVGFFGGEVFECIHANEPEGCGHTPLCSKCALRNTINETFVTGTSQLFKPVSLIQQEAGNQKEKTFLISSKKVGDMILLSFDSDSSDLLPDQI